jgi:hypothetical protein
VRQNITFSLNNSGSYPGYRNAPNNIKPVNRGTSCLKPSKFTTFSAEKPKRRFEVMRKVEMPYGFL